MTKTTNGVSVERRDHQTWPGVSVWAIHCRRDGVYTEFRIDAVTSTYERERRQRHVDRQPHDGVRRVRKPKTSIRASSSSRLSKTNQIGFSCSTTRYAIGLRYDRSSSLFCSPHRGGATVLICWRRLLGTRAGICTRHHPSADTDCLSYDRCSR